MSNRVVYVGGFSRGRECADTVGNVLENYYDEVDALTFPEAMHLSTDQMRTAVTRADVVTHSSGILALYGTNPKEVHAFGAPLPASRLRLVGRTVVKSTQMFMDPYYAELPEAIRFHRQSVSELMRIGSKDTRTHWSYFLDGTISSTDAVQFAQPLVDKGSQVNLIWGQDDRYFQPNETQIENARELGVGVVFLSQVAHDSLVIRPETTLESYFSGSGVISPEEAAKYQIFPEIRQSLSQLSSPAAPPSPTE